MDIKIYDISQEVLSSEVYPGDPKAITQKISDMNTGDLYNLTTISMCAHNGTHVDAPNHFIKNGKGMDEVSLNKFIGPAYVHRHEGLVTGEDADKIFDLAKKAGNGAEKRILIKGNAEVTLEAATTFRDLGIDLIGNESQTVGPFDSPMEVHLVLLGAEIVLLEGIRLGGVRDGIYLLNAAPLNIKGSDGSPCRAVLIEGIIGHSASC